jgi:predicted nucleic acid-binding Zn finger protein
MNIKKTKDGYKVESASRKGKFYVVDPDKPWCDCADYRFREMKRKGVCKHIKAVREYVAQTQQKTLQKEQKKTDEVVAFIEEKGGEVDALELIDRFGDEKVDRLLQLGEIIEKQGKIKILK